MLITNHDSGALPLVARPMYNNLGVSWYVQDMPKTVKLDCTDHYIHLQGLHFTRVYLPLTSRHTYPLLQVWGPFACHVSAGKDRMTQIKRCCAFADVAPYLDRLGSNMVLHVFAK